LCKKKITIFNKNRKRGNTERIEFTEEKERRRRREREREREKG
jgi:hypothetical protein